jgi:hypothetical protein
VRVADIVPVLSITGVAMPSVRKTIIVTWSSVLDIVCMRDFSMGFFVFFPGTPGGPGTSLLAFTLAVPGLFVVVIPAGVLATHGLHRHPVLVIWDRRLIGRVVRQAELTRLSFA